MLCILYPQFASTFKADFIASAHSVFITAASYNCVISVAETDFYR